MSKSLYQTIKDTTPPTSDTVGIVGQKYLDTTTKNYYICTYVDNGPSKTPYTWEQLAKSTDLDSKLNTNGGTISGNLSVQGNLTVVGETITEKQKELEVEDNFIYTNANKVDLTALLSGIAIYKNGTDIYAIAYDPATDSVKLGLGTRDEQGVFHFNTGEGSPVAVRADSADLTDNHIIIWNAASHKFIDSGKTIADKANTDASNLTVINATSWNTKLNNGSWVPYIKTFTNISAGSYNTDLPSGANYEIMLTYEWWGTGTWAQTYVTLSTDKLGSAIWLNGNRSYDSNRNPYVAGTTIVPISGGTEFTLKYKNVDSTSNVFKIVAYRKVP